MSNGDAPELLKKTRQGDKEAIGVLLNQHRARLRKVVAVRMDPRLRVRFDPSDVLQEVLISESNR